MQLALNVVIHLASFLESFLAYLAAELLNYNLLEIAAGQSFFFLFFVIESSFFPVYTQLFLFLKSYSSPLVFFSLLLGLFLPVFFHLEFLIADVSLLYIFD